MPTHQEYALMAQDAYSPEAKASKIPNWTRLTDYTYEPANQWGLGVAIYRNWCRTEYVIAYRGTDLSSLPTAFANLMADLKLICCTPLGTDTHIQKMQEAQQRLHNFIDQSLSFLNGCLKSVGIVSVSYTGHSLGAVIAEINACKTNRRAITFESPGCKHLLSVKEQQIGNRNIICYIHGANLINSAFEHVGLVRKISYESSILLKAAVTFLDNKYTKLMASAVKLYKQHSIDGIVDKLQDSKLDTVEYKKWPGNTPIAFEFVIKTLMLLTQQVSTVNTDGKNVVNNQRLYQEFETAFEEGRACNGAVPSNQPIIRARL